MKMNERFFETIDSSHKSYWLGYISQAGEVDAGAIRVRERSHLHLLKLARELAVAEEHVVRAGERSEIIVRSHRLSADLARARPRAGHAHDYWRGVVDASGKLSEQRKELKLVADELVCSRFLQFCRKLTGTKSKVSAGQMRLHGDNAMRVAAALYADSILYLDQNYKIYTRWEQFDSNAIFPRVVKFFHRIMPQRFSVRRCRITSALEGDCSYKNGRYYIRVNNNLNDKESVNCLLHELAHIDTMLEQEEDVHGTAFGVAYSRIYKLFEAEFTS